MYGCQNVPETEPLSSVEVPASFWGREEKTCPNCSEVIHALAVRCRYCGAEFDSARPSNRDEWSTHAGAKDRERTLRNQTFFVVAGSLIPLFGVIAALIGLSLYRNQRNTIRAMGGLIEGSFKIAFAVGFAQSALVLVAMLTYALVN